MTAVAGNASATLNFTAAAGGITEEFSIKVVDAAGAQVGDLRIAPGGDTSVVINGLTNGTAVKFEVTATNLHGSSPVAVSNVVTPVAPVLVTAVPTITGTAAVGRILTANTGTWGPAPVTLAYQWFGNGIAIIGATTSTHTLQAGDAGKAITVRVTGSKTGYADVSRTSAAVTVANVAVGALSALRDFNADGRADLVARDSSGVLWIYPGNGSGGFGARVGLGSGWNAMTAISASGDLTGDGQLDLVARDSSGVLWIYPGNGSGGFGARVRLGSGWNAMTAISASGDLTGDGKADLLARDSSGVLWSYPGQRFRRFRGAGQSRQRLERHDGHQRLRGPHRGRQG